jgi:hypothetical protein
VRRREVSWAYYTPVYTETDQTLTVKRYEQRKTILKPNQKQEKINIMYRFVILALCLSVAQHLFSQEIKGAEGRWEIVNITPELARDRAIEEAKKKALRMAGIEEHIKVTETLAKFDANDRSTQIYNEFSSSEQRGAISDYTIVKDTQEKNSRDGKFYAVVVIDARVKKYHSTVDPEFKVNVSGLRSNGYKNGEAITFSVLPNKDGYLKVFLFENTDVASVVFPNDYELNRRFKAKEKVAFPTVGIDYTAEKSTDKKLEHNLLLFVYTKSDIPFYGDTTYPRVLGWVNGIEPNEREVIVENILITE